MNLRNRPVRVVAAVGAVVAAGTATCMALAAGTASADEPGRCTQNVNVRKEPDQTSRIVALCPAGKQVKLGAEKDGFVQLDELGGWASKDFVKADESSSSSSSSDGDDHAADGHSDADHGDDNGDQHDSDGPAANVGHDTNTGGGGLGGLLG